MPPILDYVGRAGDKKNLSDLFYSLCICVCMKASREELVYTNPGWRRGGYKPRVEWGRGGGYKPWVRITFKTNSMVVVVYTNPVGYVDPSFICDKL